jgi:hypothetical protein
MTDERPDYLISNRPPLREEARVDLEEKLMPLAARRDAIIDRLPKVIVTDNATAGNAADFVNQANLWLDDVDGERKAVKKPYDEAIDVIQGRTKAFADPVLLAVQTVEQRIKTFRSEARERARKQAEEQRKEEARLRAEAAAREKGQLAVEPAPVVEPVRPEEISLPAARGDYGAKVTDKREKIWTITEPRQLPDEILKAPKVRDAMLAAIKQLSKLRDDIPGASFEWSTGDSIRKGG